MIRRWITGSIWVVALFLYAWLPGWTAWHGMNNNDFKHLYLGMKALLDGISPYSFQALHHQAALQGHRQIALNPYVYLPFTGHALSFLAPFRLEQAAAVWFFTNHLFTAGVVWILSSLWPRQRWRAAGLLTLAFAVSIPLVRTLTAGQLNMALLFMICLAWRYLHNNRPKTSGAILAFAALFKLMPGIFGLYFLMQRRWAAAASMTLVGLVLFLLSTGLAGLATTLEFLPVLQQMGYGKSTWPEVFSFWDDPPNQSLNSFFTHILAANDHTTPWVNLGQTAANLATILVVIILLAVYLIRTWRSSQPRHEQSPLTPADDHAYAATLLLGLLIPSLMWDHYLVMTILPVALLIRDSLAARRYLITASAVLCYAIICLPWPFSHPAFQHGTGTLLMSLKLWPTLALFGLNLCFSQKQSLRREPLDKHNIISTPTSQERLPGV